jgi:mannose-1-phosphate guanylyltransferase / mannose-6-phosphate isomerase
LKLFIMAGGSGTRLFPLSRENHPKQFLKLFDGKSLLQLTLERFKDWVLPEDILLVTGEKYSRLIREQIEEIGFHQTRCVVEPVGKNTAPGMALGMKFAMERMGLGWDEPVFVAPSDHIILPKESFLEKVSICMDHAKEGKIVTLGIRPTRPETGYGYIRCGKAIQNAFEVMDFVEKPDLNRAEGFIREGNYYWNGGMFAFTASTLMEELKMYHEDLYEEISNRTLEEFLERFPKLESISIDSAVAEKSKKVRMVPLDIYWNDVGSWDSLYDYLQSKTNHVMEGDAHGIDCEDSMLLSDGRLLVGIGLKDTYIIETKDVVLAIGKGHGQKIKTLLQEIHEREEIQEHLRVIKPWGAYTVLDQGEGYKVKKIEVHPGQRLSLQSHEHRNEHWVMVKGVASVTIGEEEREVLTNQHVMIPKGVKHRISNYGTEVVEFIETQHGTYTGEDDIVRYEDIYNRV